MNDKKTSRLFLVPPSGETTGDFIVLDAGTGDVLYRFHTGDPVGGGVITYEIDGKQYVGVMSGRPSGFWADKNPSAPTVFVFCALVSGFGGMRPQPKCSRLI